MNHRKNVLQLKPERQRKPSECDWKGCHKKGFDMIYAEDDRHFFCAHHFIQARQSLEMAHKITVTV